MLVAPIAMAVFNRTAPFVFVYGQIAPSMARAGQVVTVTWWVRDQSKSECGGTVIRVLVDSQGVQWTLAPTPAVYTQVRKGDTFSVNFNLPENMAAGPATYHSLPRYWCNWAQHLWPVHGAAPPITFTVIK